MHVLFPPFTTEDTRVTVASMESQSGLRGSSTTTASDLTNILPSHSPFQQLSSSEQEELKAELHEDVIKMERLFGSLVLKTRDSVEERIPVRQFATSILALSAYEPEQRDQSFPDEHREEIIRAESISEIFDILNPYWNYLIYEILEYIIELYGTSEDIERLRSYNEKLLHFCERRTFGLPVESGSGIGNEKSLRQEEVCVMLNVCEDIRAKDLFQIRVKIAKILQVSLSALIIQSVHGGIAQLQTSEGQP